MRELAARSYDPSIQYSQGEVADRGGEAASRGWLILMRFILILTSITIL